MYFFHSINFHSKIKIKNFFILKVYFKVTKFKYVNHEVVTQKSLCFEDFQDYMYSVR